MSYCEILGYFMISTTKAEERGGAWGDSLCPPLTQPLNDIVNNVFSCLWDLLFCFNG